MYDAAVIGGGLAGCMAAITLARQNRRVLLLEAGTYPRAKVCGEFLSPECMALFDNCGFTPELKKLNPTTIQTVRVTAADGSEWRSRFPQPGVGVSRYALDEALANYAEQSGADIRDGMRVTDIEGTLRNGFTLTAQTATGSTTFRAKTVIAAHGKRSNLDRALNRAFLNRSQPYVGLKRHFTGAALPGHIDLHVFGGGYCGMSQVEGGATNVCLLVRQDVFQRAFAGARGDVEPFIAWMREQNRHLDQWLERATPVYDEWLSIAQVPFMTKTPVEGDILLAGDAAGMVAPLAGDGMAMAMHSGVMAAEHVKKALETFTASSTMARDYAKAWNKAFSGRLRLGRVLQSIMLRPALISPGLRLMNLLPAIGDVLVAQTRDLKLAGKSS